MATFYFLSNLADVVLDAWILFLVDEMESTKLLAWWFQGGYCSLILALANAGSHGSLTPQSNYKNCATLAVNDQAEYNFIHLLDVWSFLGGSLICLGPITNVFFVVVYSFLRGMINSLNEGLYLSDLDICGCRLSWEKHSNFVPANVQIKPI